MSLSLDVGTFPKGLRVSFKGGPICLGDYEISLHDFFAVVGYVLTNTDLEPNDLRLEFVKQVKSMKQVNGWSPKRKRLAVVTKSRSAGQSSKRRSDKLLSAQGRAYLADLSRY